MIVTVAVAVVIVVVGVLVDCHYCSPGGAVCGTANTPLYPHTHIHVYVCMYICMSDILI